MTEVTTFLGISRADDPARASRQILQVRDWQGARHLLRLDGTGRAAHGRAAIGADQMRTASRSFELEGWRSSFPSPALPRDFSCTHERRGSVDEGANGYAGMSTLVLVRVLRRSTARAASSLEVRVPLRDREVMTSPGEWIGGAASMCKATSESCRSEGVRRHVKFQTIRTGIPGPMSKWLRGPLSSVFRDLVLPRRDMLGLPMDQAAVQQLFRSHAMHVENSPWPMWRLLSLALWEARHYQPALLHA